MRNFNRSKLLSLIFAFFAVFLTAACAHGNAYSPIWNSKGEVSDYESLIKGLITQKVIILGENHGLRSHQSQHLQILKSLREAGLQVHVGLEFFSYPDQAYVNQYKAGQLSEPEFLQQIKWGSPSFDFYRDQALFPQESLGEMTWALNAPRSLTSVVAKVGIDNLTQEQKAILPPDFQLGSAAYKKRFLEAMGGTGHFPDTTVVDRYFAAQSVWDDTMAWRVQQILKAHPQAVVVIIVGEFHVQYGGGLPDRLRARGIQQVATVSQLNLSMIPPVELQKEVIPHNEYGPRADWIWGSIAVD